MRGRARKDLHRLHCFLHVAELLTDSGEAGRRALRSEQLAEAQLDDQLVRLRLGGEDLGGGCAPEGLVHERGEFDGEGGNCERLTGVRGLADGPLVRMADRIVFPVNDGF